MVLVWLWAVAWAQEPAVPALESASVSTEVVDADPQAWLDEAWRRVRLGDGPGARRLAAAAAARDPRQAAEAQYAIAVAWELDAPAEALAAYDAVIDAAPDGPRAHDARFRRAMVLARLGRPKDADKALAALKPWGRLPPDDRIKVDLCRATWRLQDKPTRGRVRALQRVLDRVPAGTADWFAARAEVALVDEAAARSADGALDGRRHQLETVLAARVAGLGDAEAALQRLVAIGASGPLLEALVVVAGAYEGIADDLLRSPVPDTLSEAEQVRYRQLVAAAAGRVLLKARAYASLADDHATRAAWEGPETAVVRALLDRLTTRVEALDDDGGPGTSGHDL